MGQVIRVSLPTYNALIDTNPDHFALYSDQDWILIKEKARGSVSISGGGSSTISHNLGYIPFVLVFSNGSLSEWISLIGNSWSGSDGYFDVDTSNLYIYNTIAGGITAKYYIFYDQII